MKIINARPPNFAKIVIAFPMAVNAGVVFAYHDAAYAPGISYIPSEILAHEQVHIDRQGGTIETTEAWWDRYIDDLLFRFEEELLAHKAEYRALCGPETSRQPRRYALRNVSKKLSSPLYGKMVSAEIAATLLKEAENE